MQAEHAAPPASAVYNIYTTLLDVDPAQLDDAETALLDQAFDAGADYLAPTKEEIAARGSKKGTQKSKNAAKARKTRLETLRHRMAAAARGNHGPAWLQARDEAAAAAAEEVAQAEEARAVVTPSKRQKTTVRVLRVLPCAKRRPRT